VVLHVLRLTSEGVTLGEEFLAGHRHYTSVTLHDSEDTEILLQI